MATLVMDQENRNGFPFGLFVILGIIIALAITVSYNAHAGVKHGDDAWEVRNCIQKGGTIDIWINPDTNRQAHVCQIENGKFGIQIQIDGREITSFIKNKMSRLDQVYQYLRNSGYTPIQ